MHPVKIETITGFSSDSPVLIWEDKGGKRPFYQFPNETEFNLPRGIYYTENKLKTLKKPLKYLCPKLPEREKNIKIPVKNFLFFTENPNKCSVMKKENGTFIYMDNRFKTYPRPMKVFILFHELGHYLYYSEDFCDIFSADLMLKKGYNPSQCYHSSHHNLENLERKKTLFNFLQDVRKK
jgi:hypothetical protein